MKVVALSENTSSCGMKVEHGLCLYIETKKHKILFDFGASDQFVQNAGKLGDKESRAIEKEKGAWGP